MNNRIVLIAIWFGTLPSTFRVWVETAGRNPFLQFVVITDQNYEGPLPANVRLVAETTAGYSKRAALWLGEGFELRNPYKLCDLKVLLFHLYPELVTGSTWWGYCDLDIVWGDMSLDVNDAVLGQFDKVGLNAHCSLWRTADYPALLKVMMEPQWLEKLRDCRFNYALDEHLGLGALYGLHPKVYLFRHDLNLDPHAGTIVPTDYYHRGPNSFFWHEGRLVWRVFTGRGYYDTHHSYLHYQKQPMVLNGALNNDAQAYLIRYGLLEAVGIATCERPTNLPSARLRWQALRRRLAFTVRNRWRGGNRQKVALK